MVLFTCSGGAKVSIKNGPKNKTAPLAKGITSIIHPFPPPNPRSRVSENGNQTATSHLILNNQFKFNIEME